MSYQSISSDDQLPGGFSHREGIHIVRFSNRGRPECHLTGCLRFSFWKSMDRQYHDTKGSPLTVAVERAGYGWEPLWVRGIFLGKQGRMVLGVNWQRACGGIWAVRGDYPQGMVIFPWKPPSSHVSRVLPFLNHPVRGLVNGIQCSTSPLTPIHRRYSTIVSLRDVQGLPPPSCPGM